MQAFLSRLKGLVFKSNRPRREKVHGKWSIGIFTGTSPFDLSADDSASNPVIRAADVTDGQANFVPILSWSTKGRLGTFFSRST